MSQSGSMSLGQAAEILADTVACCGYLMPQTWIQAHLAEARQAIQAVQEAAEAIDWGRPVLEALSGMGIQELETLRDDLVRIRRGERPC